MNERVVVIGGGEHAHVVAEAAQLGGLELEGYLNSVAAPELMTSIPYLGRDDVAEALARTGSRFIVGIGGLTDTTTRRAVVQAFDSVGAVWTTVVHPSALVSPNSHIDAGGFVGAAAVVNGRARIGRHVIVNTGAIIEHDVEIGDHAIIGPGVTIGGGTVVEAGSVIGLGASVRDHITIGAGTLVAMGAVVTRATRPGARVMGVPAREVGRSD